MAPPKTSARPALKPAPANAGQPDLAQRPDGRGPLPGPLGMCRPVPSLVAAAGLLAAGSALAQDAPAPSRPLVVSTSVASSLTHSSFSGGSTRLQSGETVLRLSPGVQVRSRSGRVVGSLDYSLSANYYSRQRGQDELEHQLSAAFVAEAVPNWLYVDGRASVSRQNVSAFGLQTDPGSSLGNRNRTDVLNLSLSPYVRGLLGERAEYELRLSIGATNGYRSITADSTNAGASVTLRSRRSLARLGWSLQATQQHVDFRAGRATETARVSAGLSYAPDPDLVFSVRAGQESTDIGGFDRRRVDNWGFGVRWTPTERTVIGLDTDRRYFGDGHQVTLEHRLRRTAFRYTSTRDATSSADAFGVGQAVTLYQLYFVQFAAVEPDPVRREALVRDFLRSIGQDPNALVGGGSVRGGVTLQRRDDLGMVLNGRRTSLTLQAFNSDSRVIDSLSGQPDDGRVRQHGLLSTVSHRLTPISSVNLGGSWQKTEGNEQRAGNELTSISLGWNTLINERTSANVGARYSIFDSVQDQSYRETSLTATLNLRF